VAKRAEAARKAAERSEQSEEKEAWKILIMEGAGAGAKNAHRMAKLPTEWKPTVTLDEGQAVLTADPMKLLAGQRREYARQWRARAGGQKRWHSEHRQALCRLQPSEIREASLSAKRDAAQTYDGFHPRHFSLLDDPALEALADIYEAAEMLASWPQQITLVTMPALPKPDGGYRLIGIFAAAYRVWARARRPIADKWEAQHDRPYFAAGTNRSAIDAVWRQALRAEAATAEQGATAAAVLTDLEKFFENIDHELLLERAEKHGLPLPLVKLALAAYSGPRMIRMRDFVAEELFADRGIIAGCSLATTLTRVYALDTYDEFVRRCPEVHFDNYIDDNVISAEGPPEKVARVLGQAAVQLHHLVTEQLRCTISRRKAKIVAAGQEVGRKLKTAAARFI
jgi:hypothetical protein